MTTLTINFHGICVNFANVIPGVPHRIVLPDAMGVRFGTVQTSGQPAAAYYLLPHYAFIRAEPASEIAGASFVKPIDRVHVRILNESRHRKMEYPSVGGVMPYSLSHYAGNTMTFSDEVVLGGRAACYFDFDRGTVGYKATPLGAVYTSVEVETDGPPELLIRSFPDSPGGAVSEQLTLSEARVLTVANVDFDLADEDDNVDFLLNYLVARNGIPKVLAHPVPGMPGLQSQSPQEIADALNGLAQRIAGGRGPAGEWVTKAEIRAWTPDVLTASCSNSTWP